MHYTEVIESTTTFILVHDELMILTVLIVLIWNSDWSDSYVLLFFYLSKVQSDLFTTR